MAATLAAQTINVETFDEDIEVVETTSDVWSGGTYKRKTTVFGGVRTWKLECSEDNVAWASSVAKVFQDNAKLNASVNFTYSDNLHNINLSVYIIGVTVSYSDAPKLRRYSVSLREAM